MQTLFMFFQYIYFASICLITFHKCLYSFWPYLRFKNIPAIYVYLAFVRIFDLKVYPSYSLKKNFNWSYINGTDLYSCLKNIQIIHKVLNAIFLLFHDENFLWHIPSTAYIYIYVYRVFIKHFLTQHAEIFLHLYIWLCLNLKVCYTLMSNIKVTNLLFVIIQDKYFCIVKYVSHTYV